MKSGKISFRSNPSLWKKIVANVKKSNKGGNPGQWSARKAQLAVKKYIKKGGKYLTKKSKFNSLHKWTSQKWRTKSGKPSVTGSHPTYERYLPQKLINSKGYNYSSKLKKLASKKKKQYSNQPKKLRKKLSNYLKRN